VSDERPTPYDAQQQPPERQPDPPDTVHVDVSRLPPLPVHPRSQRMPGSNIGRWATFGCVAVMLLLVVLLMVGVNLTKRTAWMSYARAQQRLVEELPSELPSGERLRTERNLQRFRARLETTPDPFPLMGRFLGRVGAAFDDDRLTVEEVAELNQLMEEALEGGGDLGQ
jgi:hypothetical protein